MGSLIPAAYACTIYWQKILHKFLENLLLEVEYGIHFFQYWKKSNYKGGYGGERSINVASLVVIIFSASLTILSISSFTVGIS